MNPFFNTLKDFFAPPRFEGDEEKRRTALLLNQIVSVIWAILLLAVIVAVLDTEIRSFALVAVAIVAVGLMIVTSLNHAGRLDLASQITVGILLMGFTYMNFVGAAEPRPILLMTTIAILVSGLLMGPRGAMTAAILLALQHTIISILNMTGLITPLAEPASPLESAIVNAFSYILIGWMFRLAIQRIQFVVNQLQASNSELQQLSTSLEQRVAERTKALITSTEVSRRLSTILDQRQLVSEVVEQVNAAYGYYHTQIYFLDDKKENLVMAGGTGEAGKLMLAQFHKVLKGRGLVGRAAATNQAVLVKDTRQNPEWLPNPLLPDTRSELAIPISIGDEVLGVLDVQQNIADGLQEENADALRAIVNQVAVAFQNTRAYTDIQRSQAQLAEALQISRLGNWEYDVEHDLFTFNEQFYSVFRTTVEKVGSYKLSSGDYARLFVHPEDAPLVGGEIQGAMMSKDRHYSKMLEHRIIFADGEIGYISVRFTVERDENGKIIRFYGANQDITERRRLEEINRKRAFQQETINTVTQRIQGATNVETALKIAARELGQVLGGRQTVVSLDMDSLSGEAKVTTHE